MATWTIPPIPTLPPMPTMAPLPWMPTALPEIAAVVTTLLPALSTLAPGVENAVTDAVNSAKDGIATALNNVTGSGGDRSVTTASDNGIIPKGARPFIIPVIALCVGTGMMQVENIGMWGKLVLYFGAQSFMNIFMSWALGSRATLPSGTVLDDGTILTKDLKGCPAGFVITAFQQVVSFLLFVIYFLAVFNTKWKYMPKRLTTNYEYISVVLFGMVFALNIALNNFSLGYITIGVNLILRSCLPLSTYASQQFLSNFGMYAKKPFKILEVTLMLIGVCCAVLYTWADFKGKFTLGGKFIGVIACVSSVLCGSLNLALAGVLGDTKLNVLDTVAYMAIPATVTLLPIIFFFQKPVPDAWFVMGAQHMTDWEILKLTWHYSKDTVGWLAFSGVLSFMYNIVQITIVHTLSPSATAFGGNFNKAALTFMTLCLPFLQTTPNPPWPYIGWQWVALLVNILAFTYYSFLQIQAKQEAQRKEHQRMEGNDSDEEWGSSEEESSYDE